MALTYPQAGTASPAYAWGLAYAWSGFAIMWAFWTCFAVFLPVRPGPRSTGRSRLLIAEV